MKDRYELKTEIDEAQQDLERNLNALKDVITEKVDIRSKVEHKVSEKKDQAMDYVVRGREIGLDVLDRVRQTWRDQPLVIVGIVGGLFVVGGLVLMIRHEIHEAD
jgi:ElaB/YqjD/DUF883 family membrane-anchored ribosome-binding protein